MRTPSVRIFFIMTFQEFSSSEKARRPHYLVLGHPIDHSLSPLMHQTALDYYGLDASYHAVDLQPGEMELFSDWLNNELFLGANVTIPYKQRFLDLADRHDSSVRESGSLNTLVRDREEWAGYNTDIDGFLTPLLSKENDLRGMSAILFGSGGASRAVQVGLRRLKMEKIYIVSRTPASAEEGERAASSAEVNPDVGASGQVSYTGYEDWPRYAEEAALVVNATPLGMLPGIESSPVKTGQEQLLKGKVCYDLVYNPMHTRFLQQAEEAGAETIGGIDMFIGQGARSFEYWTGRKMPVEKVKALIVEELRMSESESDH